MESCQSNVKFEDGAIWRDFPSGLQSDGMCDFIGYEFVVSDAFSGENE
jgi:hypothetical protein